MQELNGAIKLIDRQKYLEMLSQGHTNLVTVGDVFKVRGCFFEVETISNYGISAKGISKREFKEKRKARIR